LLIKFLKHYSLYNPGEIAGFEDKEAEQLIKQGIAEKHIDSPPKDKMVKRAKTK